jgi:hypothetical protein
METGMLKSMIRAPPLLVAVALIGCRHSSAEMCDPLSGEDCARRGAQRLIGGPIDWAISWWGVPQNRLQTTGGWVYQWDGTGDTHARYGNGFAVSWTDTCRRTVFADSESIIRSVDVVGRCL